MEYHKYMLNAISQAREALSAKEVPVGCVFVYKDNIIAQSRNTVNVTKNATRHAEMNCIDQVLQFCKTHNLDYREAFKGVTVIVTVEPCIMCAAALYDLEVKQIIFGCTNDRFGGNTVIRVADFYPHERTTIFSGINSEEAMDLLKSFYKGTNPNAPCPKIKANK